MTLDAFLAWAPGAAVATVIASIVAMIAGISAAIFTARASVKNGERKILIENITQERAKWRGKIRETSLSIHKAAVKKDSVWLAELKLTLATSLNPIDQEDNLILDLMERFKDEGNLDAKLSEFSDRVALLLKHDWERAKREAEPDQGHKVERLTLQQLNCKRACH